MSDKQWTPQDILGGGNHIKALLGIIEHGGLLFHITLPDLIPPESAVIQANLVSALVSYTTQVKKDALQSIQMTREQMLFHCNKGIIFALVVDAQVRPQWVEHPLALLHDTFCHQYPSISLDTDQSIVFDVTQFDPFKQEAATYLRRLDVQLHLILTLVEERLLMEEEIVEVDLFERAAMIAQRLVRQAVTYRHAPQIECRLDLVDRLLSRVNGEFIYRNETQYVLECENCHLCQEPRACFYAEILEELLSKFNLDHEVYWDEASHTRTIMVEVPSEEE